MHVADLLNVPISEVNDRITWLEMTFPSVYLSFASKRIKTVVQTMYDMFYCMIKFQFD